MAKEKLNINKVPATLFVGVGGIGSDIVARVAGRCQIEELDSIRFVAMDTNANDQKTVRKSADRIKTIQTSSTQSVLDYLKNDEDAHQNWFPCNTILYPKTVSEGAGQVRAISRLALHATIKTGEINKLYKAIDELFLKDGEEGKQALRVVVVSSASGGTGSGIAMTVGMLIRQYLHKHYRERSAIIRGYLLLPGVMDTVIRTEAERVSQRRNGYATIKEINAFMMKASGFCGVRKELARYADLHVDVPTTTGGVERLETLPFDFCFLLDRIDQSMESMQTLEQYKEFAAQSLFEQNIGPMQGNAFGMEDNIIKEFISPENLGRNRFGGIGASLLRYPYEEIADYIAFSRAIDRIGGGDAAASWLKYDAQYKNARAEFKKKRAISRDKAPELPNVYVNAVENDEQRFGIDIKSYLTDGTENLSAVMAGKLKRYLKALKYEIHKSFISIPEIAQADAQTNANLNEADYSDETVRSSVGERVNEIRRYETLVKSRAKTAANTRAKAIFYNAPSIGPDVAEYNLETLLRSSEGAMHPNAIRYVLYSLLAAIEREKRTLEKNRSQQSDGLDIYAPNANEPGIFDVSKTKDSQERCLDDLVRLAANGGKKEVFDKLNKLIPGYASSVLEFCDTVLFEEAYSVAIAYINGLNKELEAFYSSFENKVVSLGKAKEDIVSSLHFNKGDSVYNVCGEKQYLERMCETCPETGDGLLLPDDLNVKIFEAIKKNAESTRLSEYDPYGDHPREDVFDTVLIDYFRRTIRDDCDEFINLNIIRAIYAECTMKAFFDANEGLAPDEEPVIPVVKEPERLAYLKQRIEFGQRLAASGIGFSSFAEARDISVGAFSNELLSMKDLDVKMRLEAMGLQSVASDTVSRYDLRFFNALYNVTPDRLARFRAPEQETGEAGYSEGAGIYYTAYHDYIKTLGPDSTKSATISLHIDKRWDSLTEMPEISMDDHYLEMVKIHSALVYAVVHSMVKTFPSSRFDAKKRIYALEDTEGDRTPLVVSNNTECDEFYEVLDALYRDRASVAAIYKMANDRNRFDVEYNRRYSETAFFKDAMTFKVGDGHDGATSMFEIPLCYYNSLPRAKLDGNELSIMIDSVINVVAEEVDRYEQEVDRPAIQTSRLEHQFRLLIDNYAKFESLRKNTALLDSQVLNMVFRKVSNRIKQLGTFNFEDKVEAMRAYMNETAARIDAAAAAE